MDEAAEKVCSKCGVTKPRSEFYRDLGCRDGHRPDCKSCNKAAQKARRDADPEPNRSRAREWQRNNRERYRATQRAYVESGRKRVSNRKSYLKRTYGISVGEYDEMLAAQQGVCAICGRTPRDDISLHVDHCHVTGRLRGLLCFRCNNGLGDFGHDPALLEAALGYLAVADDAEIRRRVDALVTPPGSG
jgi:hypothetical protein